MPLHPRSLCGQSVVHGNGVNTFSNADDRKEGGGGGGGACRPLRLLSNTH